MANIVDPSTRGIRRHNYLVRHCSQLVAESRVPYPCRVLCDRVEMFRPSVRCHRRRIRLHYVILRRARNSVLVRSVIHDRGYATEIVVRRRSRC